MLDTRHKELEERTRKAVAAFAEIPTKGLGAFLRIQACLAALVVLEDRCLDMDQDPYPSLLDMLGDIEQLPKTFDDVFPHIDSKSGNQNPLPDEHEGTRELFQTAWTAYSSDTYRHSLSLIQKRLERSGFHQDYFTGKRCLDSGCGTGRFAMALAGAKEVIAADFGEDSLAALEQRKAEYNVPQVIPVRMDVTDLSRFDSDSFDFVASQGVLHHTPHPDRGIQEYFRVTRPGGYYWLYLYGAGGIYWPTYDRLRALLTEIEPKTIRAVLRNFGLREGLIYTFLDNFLAPRVYYSPEQVLALLRPLGNFRVERMKGSSPVDDTQKLLATQWGRELFGPDGEVRIVITKESA